MILPREDSLKVPASVSFRTETGALFKRQILFTAGAKIKFRVNSVEILAVKMVLNDSQAFTKTGRVK